MSQLTVQEEIPLIQQETNELLLKLNKCHNSLQELISDIKSRPFSSRLHGQFDHELKKSQSIIKKLSALLRRYHSFEFDSNSSLKIHKDPNNNNTKPIDINFIYSFKDICIKIEKEWRIGTKLITQYQKRYPPDNDSLYHSDNDAGYKYNTNKKKRKRKNNNRIRSNSSSPVHTFSNPNSAIYQHNNSTTNTTMEPLNLSKSQIIISNKEHLYNKKIMGKNNDFLPYMDEERLSSAIRDIADDLQYIIELNQQISELVDNQQDNVNKMEENTEDVRDNVESGNNTLMSIRRSPTTYAILGGLTLAAVGAPVLLVGVSIKAAISGALGFGTIGAFGGSWYANKSNEVSNDYEKNVKEQKDKIKKEEEEHKHSDNILDNIENKENNPVKTSHNHFKTKPRKRKDKHKNQSKKRKERKERMKMNNYNDMTNGNDELDVWDARN